MPISSYASIRERPIWITHTCYTRFRWNILWYTWVLPLHTCSSIRQTMYWACIIWRLRLRMELPVFMLTFSSILHCLESSLRSPEYGVSLYWDARAEVRKQQCMYIAHFDILSWPNGSSLGQIGSATDLMNARLVLLVDGKLIILSPNTDVSWEQITSSDLGHHHGSVPVWASTNNIDEYHQDREDEHRRDVHYELDILTEKAEYYWVNSKPVGNLRTSIWAVSEKGIKVSLVINRTFQRKKHGTSLR